MTTSLQIIESAMSKINILSIGEVVSAEDSQLGLDRLNALIDALLIEPTFQFQSTETTFTLPASTQTRTIGTGMQINVARPTRIEPSFVRVDGIDYPLEPIGENEYNAITLKTVSSFVPSVCFFDSGSPTGLVYFWPTASVSCEVHLFTLTALTQFADLTTDYTLPPGYQRYLEFALAVEIAPDFRVQPSPQVLGQAAASKRVIKRSNHQTPQLEVGQARGNSPSDWISGYQ